METSEQTGDLPAIKRLPFADSVEQLHKYNLHVAQVCLTASQTQFQVYKENKEKYDREAQEREEMHTKALEEVQDAKRKSLEARQRESRRRNQENLTKIEHLLVDRRNKITKKEKQLMEECSARRQNYLQGLIGSFHHSQDRRSRIKLRQENQLQRSLLLLQQNQEKVRVANERKIEILQETKSFIRQKNESAAIQNCKEQESYRKAVELQRLVLKYDAAGRHLTGIDSMLEKRTADKRKEEEKAMEKHRKKRSELQEERLRRIQQDGKKDQEKIEKAVLSKYNHLEQSVSTLESKRKQRERQLMYNTFYLQEEVEKRMDAILHKHHASQASLLNAKAQKERMHSSNLQDSFRATMRS